jgi:signal transduction histidine kinase
MKPWAPSRLSWRLVFAILPLVIAAVSLIVWLQYGAARRELLSSIDKEMGQLAAYSATGIDDLLDQRYRDLFTLAETPLIADYYRNVDFQLTDEAETYRKELTRYLQHFSTRSRVYAEILYVDAKGRVVCRVSAPGVPASAGLGAEDFTQAAARPEGWWVSPIRYVAGVGPVVDYAKPIRDDLGALKGMLVLRYDLGQIQKLLGGIRIGSSGLAYIRTPSGPVFPSRRVRLEGDVLSASRPLSRPGWGVTVEAPLEDFLGPLRGIRNAAVMTSGVVCVLLIAIVLWLVRSITRPIEALVKAAHAIGAGDLRRRVADVGTDELGTLSRAFNEMAERLERNRETQAALQAQLIQAEKLSAVGQLISSVAHELNNPLGAISGYAQILLLDTPPSRLRDDLASIWQNVLRCQKVVDNLLFFVRKSGHERRKVDLNEAVDAALELLNYRLVKTEDVEVVRDLAVDLPPVIGDFQQIVQVLVNLVGNACDAMEGLERAEGKRLIVRTRAGTDRVLVEVEDNGTGIPAEIVKHVFEPFFTTKPSGKGTGLGLPICLQIAREHGGDVTVESRPGRGTVFRIDLPPASHEELEGDDADDAPALVHAVPGRRVLVADDEKSIADLIARLLREDGDEAVVVLNGGDALRRLKEEVFDLVISDIEMEQAKG